MNSEKLSLRVLRFLRDGREVVAAPFLNDKNDRVVLRSKCGKTILVTGDCLSELQAQNLITREGDHPSITKIGRAHLKRREARDDPFLAQHRQMEKREVSLGLERQEVQVNLAESPLSRLRLSKTADGSPWLTDEMVEAGERFRRDFTLGNFMQRVTSNWDFAGKSSRGSGAHCDPTDVAIDARDRVDAAVSFMGPELAGVVTDVCCYLLGLQAIERNRRWPPRSAKLMLRTGLDLLSRHYGTKAGGVA